jgi:hypothetical protein
MPQPGEDVFERPLAWGRAGKAADEGLIDVGQREAAQAQPGEEPVGGEEVITDGGGGAAELVEVAE